MHKLQILGSQTARGGFANEKDIANKFNSWETDEDAQKWLIIMNYEIDNIESVVATVLHGFKSDVNIQISIKFKHALNIENLQVKLVSNFRGFNQIDKRPIEKYNTVLNWKIPENVLNTLKRFTGEILPNIPNPRDKRRMFIDEFSQKEQNELFNFIIKNKALIVNDILRGRGEFAAEWIIVAQKVNSNARWVLKNINEVINFFNGDVSISPKGSIKIGKILIQRKGGTPDPTSLQFKINPAELFDF